MFTTLRQTDNTMDNRMVMYRNLLWLSVMMLVPACTAFPTQAESRMNSIHSIVTIARTTQVHIRKLRTLLPASPLITVGPPSIRGLNSISQDLSLLEAQLQEPASGPQGQIEADVSCLNGYVRFLAETLNCLPAADHHARTGEGRAYSGFSESHVYVSLMKVQVYLDELLINTDKLSTC